MISNIITGVAAYFHAGVSPELGNSSQIHLVTRAATASRKVVLQYAQKVK